MTTDKTGRAGRADRADRADRTVFTKAVKEELVRLLMGRVLSFDPSCGSRTSLPAWYIHEGEEAVGGDTILIHVPDSLPARLAVLGTHVRDLVEIHKPDIVVIEQISARPYGARKFAATAHASLLKSVGAILGSLPINTPVIMVRPTDWHPRAHHGWKKGDVEDARAIGWACISEARRIVEKRDQALTKKTRSRRGRTRK